MVRKTKEDTEKTYLALLEAAADLFLEKGVAPTTLQEIAERASMTRGAIYWHFKGKEDIITALLQSYAIPHIEQFEGSLSRLPQSPAAARKFRSYLHDLMIAIVRDKRAGQTISITLHMVEFTSVENKFQAFLQNFQLERYKATLAACQLLHAQGCLRDGFEPDLAAGGLSSYIVGLLHQHYSPHPIVDLQKDGIALLDIYLNAVLNEVC